MAKAKKKSSAVKAKKAVLKKAVVKKTIVKKAAITKAKVAKPAIAAKKKATPAKKVKSTAASTTKASKKTKGTATSAAKSMAPQQMKKSERFFQNYLKPLDDRIVVLVGGEGRERRTAGGLYIPDTVSDVSGNFQGKVMAIGRGHMNKKGKVKPLDVSIGDNVVFSQFSGSQVDVEGDNIMIIRESDVLGIVK